MFHHSELLLITVKATCPARVRAPRAEEVICAASAAVIEASSRAGLVFALISTDTGTAQVVQVHSCHVLRLV